MGNRSFEQQCPPGTSLVKEKQYSTKGGSSNLEQSNSTALILYVVPDCETCNQVREFLSTRNISATEKNVMDDVSLQQELRSKLDGDLRVPMLFVGDKALSGYNPTELISVLTGAGYISAEKDSQ